MPSPQAAVLLFLYVVDERLGLCLGDVLYVGYVPAHIVGPHDASRLCTSHRSDK
ncbi:hypothetical protein JCM19233_6320 [Vibrio astriarenae]|nr:hypothetical protein JCM19233_6320 [Vibrio sp. C7]